MGRMLAKALIVIIPTNKTATKILTNLLFYLHFDSRLFIKYVNEKSTISRREKRVQILAKDSVL
jgi:hypothetical protein